MSLMEILDNLTIHCKSITGLDCKLELKLPAEVLEEFSKSLEPREKIVLEKQSAKAYCVTRMHGNGGIINLSTINKNDTSHQ